ncbi:MAG: ABC transporter permease [Myxococcota bacterium]
MDALRETTVIWTAELLRTLRSARIVVLLLLYLMFTLLSGLGVHGCSQSLKRQVEAQAAQLKEQGADPDEVEERIDQGMKGARKQFVTVFFSDDEALTEALLEIPLVLLVVFKLSLFFLPLYTGLMGFDQISGELGTKSIRYLTVRSRRSAVLFGKFLAQASLLALLMGVIDAALCLFGFLTQEGFGAGAMIATWGKFWGSALVFSLAYLALTSLCSALFRQSAVSLVTNLLALFSFWLLAFVAKLRHASVWFYRTDLLHPDASRFALAFFAHVGFAALFLGTAYLVLRRRDV